jgi:bifunctional non-homologous end joining protein LigD
MQLPEPMYASIASEIPRGREWTYEQKYDGMRVVAFASARSVHLVTRNAHDKRAQFPEITEALRALATRIKRTLILDGEIVALVRGKAAPFQALQGRLHRKDAVEIRDLARTNPAAFVAFDVLRDGRESLLRLPLSARRERLESLIGPKQTRATIRISEQSQSVKRMIAKAAANGWEGLIAKELDVAYSPGARSPSWLKLKLQHRAEFVVGGFTEPRKSREHIGALLLGYYDDAGKLCYAGNMGGGFNRESLREMAERLDKLERSKSPFADAVKTSEPAHWVTPRVVVEVKFAEWTSDGKLRQPIFLGVRDDKRPRDVHREHESLQQWAQEIE